LKRYISDLHFGGEELLTKFDNRKFSSVVEMNKYMIKQWNDTVKKGDMVIVLGDMFSTKDVKLINMAMEEQSIGAKEVLNVVTFASGELANSKLATDNQFDKCKESKNITNTIVSDYNNINNTVNNFAASIKSINKMIESTNESYIKTKEGIEVIKDNLSKFKYLR